MLQWLCSTHGRVDSLSE